MRARLLLAPLLLALAFGACVPRMGTTSSSRTQGPPPAEQTAPEQGTSQSTLQSGDGGASTGTTSGKRKPKASDVSNPGTR